MMKDYLINKWLNDDLTESEKTEFRQREDYDQLMAIIEQAQDFRASQFSEVTNFDQFKSRIDTSDPKLNSFNWVKPLLRIAAVFAVGVGLFYFLYGDNKVQIQTLAAEKKTIELPDASKVVVNALSEISYDPDSWEDKRLIELDGEAFFDVSSGSTFDVRTNMGTVTVLGTEFNVKRRSGYFEVKCFEGIVRVVTDDFQEVLEAGENFRLSGGEHQLGSNIYRQPQWTNNLSSFQRVPLYEVVAELERQYDIVIILRDVRPNILFTGAFVHEDLEIALKSITEPLDLDFEHDSIKQVSIYPREK